jgi:hypothetical protein
MTDDLPTRLRAFPISTLTIIQVIVAALLLVLALYRLK